MSRNLDDYITFVYVSSYGAGYGFTGYTDKQGNICQYVRSRDKNGQPIPFKWRFDANHPTLRVHKEEKDIFGTRAVDYLRNCPDCIGSENTSSGGKGGWYKELNTEDDAIKALEFKRLRSEASQKAINAKGAEFKELCEMLNLFEGKENEKLFKLVDFAEREPGLFLKIYNDPTRQIRALLRKGLDSHVLRNEGPMIYWENKEIGINEDVAVATLKGDDKLKKALEANITKFA